MTPPAARGRGAAPSGLGNPAFAGAVDLSALAARAARPADSPTADATAAGAAGTSSATAAPTTPTGVPAVFDVTDETFVAEVLDRSQTVPVLVDLWADWCGPCKQLSPVLERLAVEAEGAWVLAKMDVDANPAVSQQLRVQSIPTVVVAIGGQLVPGFSGAIPEAQIRQFLDAVLQAAAQAGIGQGPPPQPADPRMVEAEDALQRGDLPAARAAFADVLRRSPGDPAARSGVVMVDMLTRVSDVDPVQAIAAAAHHPEDVDAQLLAADVRLAAGQVAQALDLLVEAVRRTSGEERERVRRHFVEVLDMLPPEEPVVVAARRRLAAALF